MPIPADISELRAGYKRAFDTVARQYRGRTGVPEPLVAPLAAEVQAEEQPEPEPKKAKAKKQE